MAAPDVRVAGRGGGGGGRLGGRIGGGGRRPFNSQREGRGGRHGAPRHHNQQHQQQQQHQHQHQHHSGPTEEEEGLLSRLLEQYLFTLGDVYESREGEEHRRQTIEKLHSILVQWVIRTGQGKSPAVLSEHLADGGGIQLKIFGSTRLGVHTPDADIDVLCIAPCWITRADFFTSFVNELRGRPDVFMVSAVPEAYTPVVKFIIDGQPIDMIFVSLPYSPVIPHNLDILGPSILRGLDDAAVRSINGTRVAEKILKLVPDNVTFSLTLRAVKHWARERSLYSNVLGFLGGVNFAILVCLVCRRYPNAPPSMLLTYFFETYAFWPWPQPVFLCQYEDTLDAPYPLPASEEPPPLRKFQDWNPSHPSSQYQIMPILTPCYPSMNSAYNVGTPQFRVIHSELMRAALICRRRWTQATMSVVPMPLPIPVMPIPMPMPVMPMPVMPMPPVMGMGQGPGLAAAPLMPPLPPMGPGPWAPLVPIAPNGNTLPMLPLPPPPSFNVRASAQWWFDGLFQSSSQDFFALFNKYLEVRITTRSRSGGDKAIQAQHRNWFGFVESKIRCLVVDMEAAAAREGLFLHPQANCYHRRSDASPSALCLSSSFLGTGADGAEVEAKVLATSPSLSPSRGPRAPPDQHEFASPVQTGAHAFFAIAPTKDALGAGMTSAPPEAGGGIFTSVFFIGLTVAESAPQARSERGPRDESGMVELVMQSPAILDLKYRATCYRPEPPPSHALSAAAAEAVSEISFEVVDREQLPLYVRDDKPAPSNLQTCTPAKGARVRGDSLAATQSDAFAFASAAAAAVSVASGLVSSSVVPGAGIFGPDPSEDEDGAGEGQWEDKAQGPSLASQHTSSAGSTSQSCPSSASQPRSRTSSFSVSTGSSGASGLGLAGSVGSAAAAAAAAGSMGSLALDVPSKSISSISLGLEFDAKSPTHLKRHPSADGEARPRVAAGSPGPWSVSFGSFGVSEGARSGAGAGDALPGPSEAEANDGQDLASRLGLSPQGRGKGQDRPQDKSQEADQAPRGKAQIAGKTAVAAGREAVDSPKKQAGTGLGLGVARTQKQERSPRTTASAATSTSASAATSTSAAPASGTTSPRVSRAVPRPTASAAPSRGPPASRSHHGLGGNSSSNGSVTSVGSSGRAGKRNDSRPTEEHRSSFYHQRWAVVDSGNPPTAPAPASAPAPAPASKKSFAQALAQPKGGGQAGSK